MNTPTKKPDENPNNLLRSLLSSKPFESEVTKYGKSMEPHATQKFISENKRLHKNFNMSVSGLVLMKENPFIGASPHLYVDCSICGNGLLVVKCPSSIKHEKPSHENLSFLILGKASIFYQVQGQMGVTGEIIVISFCFTHFGIRQERFTLNPEIWKNIHQTLQQFWFKYLALEILLQKRQTLPESIALHDLAHSQLNKSKIYTPKNDSSTSPVPDLLTQNALKKNLCDSPKNDSHSYILDLGQSKPGQSKLCVLVLIKMILMFQIFRIINNEEL